MACLTRTKSGEEKNHDMGIPIPKEKNRVWRWNLLLIYIILPTISFPLWLPYVSPKEYSDWILLFVQMTFSVSWLVVALFAWRTYGILYRSRNKEFAKQDFHFLTHLSVYKEPISLIKSTIKTLANQTLGPSHHTLTVAFEERTPDLSDKINDIKNMFSDDFRRIICTVHPYGVEGEIPGKSSNCNFGLRQSISELEKEGINTDEILVTTGDSDNKFHPSYLAALGDAFSKTESPDFSLYQSPLLYNWDLDAVNVVTRVTGIMRSALMMGALIPFNINTMSVYSFSGKLLKLGNFKHPGYQMEDIIGLIHWTAVTGKRLRITLVPVPIISGPTSGRVLEEELEEWAQQARRWTIGAGEVFHYFIIKFRNIPILTFISFGITFIFYYVILLCCSSLFGLTFALSLIFISPLPSSGLLHLLPYVFIILQYFTIVLIFLLDVFCPRLMVPQPPERISLMRNLYQLIVSPLVLLAYSLVEFFAFLELAIRGREVCYHEASVKISLNKQESQEASLPNNSNIGIDNPAVIIMPMDN